MVVAGEAVDTDRELTRGGLGRVMNDSASAYLLPADTAMTPRNRLMPARAMKLSPS